MLLRLLHRLWAHKWKERVHTMDANPERGLYARLTTYTRQCRCGAVQQAQIMGDPVSDGADVEILKRMFDAQ